MAKLTATQVTGLRKIQGNRTHEVHGRTLTSLQNRFLVKWSGEPAAWRLTASGQSALDRIERAERQAQEQAEKASRPVPASAFVEPSASRPASAFPEYDDDAEAQDESAEATPEPSMADALTMIGQVHAGNAGDAVWKPFNAGDYRTALEVATRKVAEQSAGVDRTAVPRAWVDQLVILLDADARIVKCDRGWRDFTPAPRNPGGFAFQWDRLDAAATEAIRLGIAEALPPTPGQGVVRLALTDPRRCPVCNVLSGQMHRGEH